VLALRQSLYLPLDDLLFITRQYINADVSRSGIARLLKREGMPRLEEVISNHAKRFRREDADLGARRMAREAARVIHQTCLWSPAIAGKSLPETSAPRHGGGICSALA
jgi:hypothetical protein